VKVTMQFEVFQMLKRLYGEQTSTCFVFSMIGLIFLIVFSPNLPYLFVDGLWLDDPFFYYFETEGTFRNLSEWLSSGGACILDYYRNLSSEEHQILAFNSQIKLAKDLNLPLVIHSRQAEEQVMQILKNAMPVRAVIHCFSGDERFLKECLDLGFYVSFTCNITYKKAQGLRDMVKLIPLEKLMLETDAPYLSPEGFRGKRNEPMQIKLLAEAISLIRGTSVEEIADKTTKNAKEFFKLE